MYVFYNVMEQKETVVVWCIESMDDVLRVSEAGDDGGGDVVVGNGESEKVFTLTELWWCRDWDELFLEKAAGYAETEVTGVVGAEKGWDSYWLGLACDA